MLPDPQVTAPTGKPFLRLKILFAVLYTLMTLEVLPAGSLPIRVEALSAASTRPSWTLSATAMVTRYPMVAYRLGVRSLAKIGVFDKNILQIRRIHSQFIGIWFDSI